MALVRVREAFTCFRTNSYGDTYRAGDLVDEKDPAVKGREAYFESPEAEVTRRVNSVPIERATAEPGEKRYVQLDRYAPKSNPQGDPNRGGTPQNADGDGGVTDSKPAPKKRASKRVAKKA
jgi:hypothetical protein